MTVQGIQYEDEKGSDMCGYAIKSLSGLKSSEGLGSGRVIEVKDAVCFMSGESLFQTILPKVI